MKKLILIPSLAIATTLPALCAVSCGAATSKWNLKDGEFKWKHGLAEGSVIDEDAATNKYFNEIDNKLLADDLIKMTTDHVLSNPEAYVEASMVVKVSKIDKEEHRLTFSIDCKSVQNQYSNELFENHEYMEFVNFPMELGLLPAPDNSNNYGRLIWGLKALSDDIQPNSSMPTVYRNDTKWSFSCDMVIPERTLKGTINYATEEVGDAAVIMESCFGIAFHSYYFQNVSLSDK